jgi:predicted aconitase with swiveling domain
VGNLSVLAGSPIVAGDAAGELLVTAEPLSFWGGLDPTTGEIIDRRHELSGHVLTGRVLAVPHGRGSCSASGVLLEAICNDTGPVAILTSRIDPIIGLGSILAEELYGRVVPVAVLDPSDFAKLRTGVQARLEATGRITLTSDRD